MNRFLGFLVPRPDWIKVVYLFGTLGLHRLISGNSEILKNFKQFQNSKVKKKIILKFKILKFSQNLIFFQNSKNSKKIQNFHKTCSHHVHLC